MARGRGGRQRPSNPAPVSGPGALSQRTDGGPGQPIRVAPGGDFGERKALVDQQRAAPLASQASPGAAGQAPRPVTPIGPDGIFGGTDRPGEPLTAGIDFGPGAGSATTPTFDSDTDRVVRAVIAEFPELFDGLIGLLDG
jgi:hypothetical protein